MNEKHGVRAWAGVVAWGLAVVVAAVLIGAVAGKALSGGSASAKEAAATAPAPAATEAPAEDATPTAEPVAPTYSLLDVMRVEDVLKTFYTGDNLSISRALPCTDQRGQALPGEVTVAWCVTSAGNAWVSSPGIDQDWSSLTASEQEAWKTAGLGLRALLDADDTPGPAFAPTDMSGF